MAAEHLNIACGISPAVTHLSESRGNLLQLVECSPSGMHSGWRVAALLSTFRPRLQRRPSVAAAQQLSASGQQRDNAYLSRYRYDCWSQLGLPGGRAGWFRPAVQGFSRKGALTSNF